MYGSLKCQSEIHEVRLVPQSGFLKKIHRKSPDRISGNIAILPDEKRDRKIVRGGSVLVVAHAAGGHATHATHAAGGHSALRSCRSLGRCDYIVNA